MKEQEFLMQVKKDFNLSQLSLEEQKAIETYLLGEQSTIQLSGKSIKYDYYTIDHIIGGFKTDYSEVAKRAFYVAALLNTNRLINHLHYEEKRYAYYAWADIPKEIVFKDYRETIADAARYSSSNALNWLRRAIFKEDDFVTPLVKDLMHYYQATIEACLAENEASYLGERLIFTALTIGKNKADQTSIKKLETQLLEILGLLYTPEVVETTCYGLLGPIELEIPFKEEAVLRSKGEFLTKVAMATAFSFYSYSEPLRQILRVWLILKGGIEWEEMLTAINSKSPNEALGELIEALQLPSVFSVAYYSEKMLKDSFYEEGEWYEAKLRAIYEKEPVVLMESLDYSLKAKKPEAIILYGLLRKYGETPKEEVMSQLEKLMPKDIEKGYRYRKNWEGLQAAIVLYETSEVAKQKLNGALVDLDVEEVLSNYKVGAELFYKQGEAFELMAQEVGVKPLIEAGVERDRWLSKAELRSFAKHYLNEVDELILEKIKEGKDTILDYVSTFYEEDCGLKISTLIEVFDHRLKTVVNFMENYLKNQEELVRPYLEALKGRKNKNMQEAIARLFKKWDAQKLEAAIGGVETIDQLTAYIKGIYQTENEKVVPFKSTLNFNGVRDQAGQLVDEILLKYYISEYMLLKEVYLIKACEKLKAFLNPRDVSLLMSQLYEEWLEAGAETKQKNIVLLYALNAEDAGITSLKKQIDDWTEHSRGALAAFAVTAMAMNGSSLALMLTDSIAQKYKNKQVRGAAIAAMDYVAQVRGISKDVLGDKIVPSLGFNQDRTITWSYGSRAFKGVLTPDLEVVLYDETGKKIKNLPKPNAKDDVEKAEAAKEQLKGLKKQVKTVIKVQKQRLEKALMTGRTWTETAWHQLFVENPIMNGFAMSLIWVTYDEQGQVLGSFRYMEDGSFNTAEEEEYELASQCKIALLHPMDCKSELLEAWKTQLEDYEVVQAITQLDLPIYTLTEEEKEAQTISRFEGTQVYFGTVMGMMDQYDWKRTSIVDGGGYEGYYYEEGEIGVKFDLEYPYVGMSATEQVKLLGMNFYKKGSLCFDSYCYDEITQANRVLPKEVPAKLMSFALMIGDRRKAKAI